MYISLKPYNFQQVNIARFSHLKVSLDLKLKHFIERRFQDSDSYITCSFGYLLLLYDAFLFLTLLANVHFPILGYPRITFSLS